MRAALGVIVLGAFATTFGCGNGPADDLLPNGQAVTLPGRGGADPAAATPPTAAQSACAGVPVPTTLSTAKDIHDVRIVGSAVFFQAGSTVMRVGKDGKSATPIFSSPNLVRAYVDMNALITIESTDAAPDATLRVIKATNAGVAGAAFPEFPSAAAGAAPAPDPDPAAGGRVQTDPAAPPADPAALPGTTAATNLNAAAVQIFGSDDASFYILANTDAGDTLAKVSKDAPGTQTAIVAAAANVITHPQLVGTDVWYVRDAKSVLKIGLPADGTPAADPADLFDLDAACSLAVSATAAYCSLGTAVQRRDLTGKNPTTVLDAESAKTSAPLGALFPHDTTLYVPSDAPDPVVKNVIVALQPASTPAAPKFVACGRGLVTTVAVDGASVAWAEAGGGVFLAPR